MKVCCCSPESESWASALPGQRRAMTYIRVWVVTAPRATLSSPVIKLLDGNAAILTLC